MVSDRDIGFGLCNGVKCLTLVTKLPSETVLWQKELRVIAFVNDIKCVCSLICLEIVWYLKSNPCFIQQLLPTSTSFLVRATDSPGNPSVCLITSAHSLLPTTCLAWTPESSDHNDAASSQCWAIDEWRFEPGLGQVGPVLCLAGLSCPDIPIGVLQDRTCSELKTRVWVGRQS